MCHNFYLNTTDLQQAADRTLMAGCSLWSCMASRSRTLRLRFYLSTVHISQLVLLSVCSSWLGWLVSSWCSRHMISWPLLAC